MASKSSAPRSALTPILIATLATFALYGRQALLLLLKVGEVFAGVFDTSVPAFPLAGMLFVLAFITLRREELVTLLSSSERNLAVSATGIGMAVLPLPALLVFGSSLSGSYAYAAIALTTCWVGVTSALRPRAFRFLVAYLLIYVTAIGSVTILTTYFGDPLAIVVASISEAITFAFGIPAHWSAVYVNLVAAGGQPVSLVITQECSGIASLAIFFLVMGLVYLDVRPSRSLTLPLTLAGALFFIFLNAARVVTMIAGGVYGGEDLLWSLHGWVGYVYYIIGYSVVLLVLFRRPGKPYQRDSQQGDVLNEDGPSAH